MTKEDYVKIYLDALERIKAELIAEGVDVSDGTAITYEFEDTANANEVVGYYVCNEKDNARKQWRENIDGLDLTDQDKLVDLILKGLYPDDFKDGNFINDEEKMNDFFELSKSEFLESYSYLTEEEYDNTRELVKAMIKEDADETVRVLSAE